MLAVLLLSAVPKARAEEIVVAADASLADVFRVLGESFEKAAPGVDVVFNFASAEEYLAQIRQGRSPDVLVSASSREVSALTRQGPFDLSSRREIATNRLVLIAPLESGPTTLEGLAGDGVKRVAIGDPKTVSGGGYAVESLKALGLWPAVEKKAVLGQSVRQVLQFVEVGAADAGFVFTTDAIASNAVRVVAAIPDSTHLPIVYVMVAHSGGLHSDAVRRFMDHVTGAEGRRALFEQGFGTPPALPTLSAPVPSPKPVPSPAEK
jgi:molybdate transport system substrate-binding protein